MGERILDFDNAQTIRKPGERFDYCGHTLETVAIEHKCISGTCNENCFFCNYSDCTSRNRKITGQCQAGWRNDNMAVWFKEVV